MNQRELYFFLKFASKEGFLNKLRGLGTDPEILNYAESLEEKYLGIVVGAVIKNRGISLSEIQELVAAKERVEKLKSKDKESIEAELPGDLDPSIKNWAIIQIKKGKKDLLLNNLSNIVDFIKEYEIDLASYDVDSLLREMGRVTEFGNNKDDVNNYLVKVVDDANRKFAEIDNRILINWAKKKLLNIIKELEINIRKSLNETISFQDLLEESNQIKENMDAGMYRGQEIPRTPLRHREYDALISNIEFLDDWHKALSPDLSSKSIDEAIKENNEWHKDVANSGIGLQYIPINRSDIVFGPEGWKDPKNNGHIILELKNENDLKVEGSKQNHCVGGYGERIKNNECRIFSLRNINNIYQPILTIETDMTGAIVRQDYGPGNSRIEQKYHDMVTEWSSQNTLDISKLSYADKIGLAYDPNTNSETLSILATDNDEFIKKCVALNENTSQETLAILATYPDEKIKTAVAINTNTNPETLAILATDDDKYVKRYVIKNPNVTPEILAILEEDILYWALSEDSSSLPLSLWSIVKKNMQKIFNLFLGPSSKEFDFYVKSDMMTYFSQEEIKNLALNAVDAGTRKIAICQIKDPEILKQIIENESEEKYIRDEAAHRLRSLAQIYNNSKIIKLSRTINLFYKTIQAMEIL